MSTVTAAGIAFLKKPLEDAYEAAKDATKEKIKHWRMSKNLKKIQRKISAVEKVKTIWQVETAINLKEFYYPPKIHLEKKRATVNRIIDFGANKVVVQGTAGQGKSIFLRFLCSQEALTENRIPVFVELRKLSPTETLLDFLTATLRSYAFDDIEPADVLFLCRIGTIALLLDGFDEIDPSHTPRVITEIERLAEQGGDDLAIIITSRPESGIERSPKFRVVKVAPLLSSDLQPILGKLCPDQVLRTQILQAIKDSPNRIRNLLTTPLMVTLLLLVYKSEQKIPDDFSAFYDNLFWILLVRHDRSKPGFIRKRRSNLSDTELKTLFESFCYQTRLQKLLKLTGTQAIDTAVEAANVANIQTSATDFIEDMVKITCLLLEEGLNIFFIHKSVQEYFSASFICKRPDNAVHRFYNALRERHRWGGWNQELVFLAQIDRYRYLKYFYLPDAYDSLKNLGVELPDLNASFSESKILEILAEATVEIDSDTIFSFGVATPGDRKYRALTHLTSGILENLAYTSLHEREAEIIAKFGPNESFADKDQFIYTTIKVLDIIHELSLQSECLSIIKAQLHELIIQVRSAEDFLAREDRTADILALS